MEIKFNTLPNAVIQLFRKLENIEMLLKERSARLQQETKRRFNLAKLWKYLPDKPVKRIDNLKMNYVFSLEIITNNNHNFILGCILLGIILLRIIKNPVLKEKIERYDSKGRKVIIEREYNNDTSFISALINKIFK